MINFSGLNANSGIGKILRKILKLTPKGLVFPILQGPAKGMKWVVGSSHHGCWLGSYELKKQKQIVKYLKPGMVVYDIGAHVGFYTLLFSRAVGPDGRVYAFEPFPENNLCLKRHSCLNKLENVLIEQYAVSDSTGEVMFYSDQVSNYMGSIIKINQSDNIRRIIVKTIILDKYVYHENNSPPDLIKMDIEGAEYHALSGMENILKNVSPILFLSLHGPEVARECRDFIRKFNYKIYNLDGCLISNYDEELPTEIVALPSSF
jgi:FkbM family methyltransferase